MTTNPKYLCVGGRCAEIHDYYQPYVAPYNHVEDQYLCISRSGACRVREGNIYHTVVSDPKDDKELLALLKEVYGWATKTQQRLLRNYITSVDLPGYIHFHRICMSKDRCPKGPLQAEAVRYKDCYDQWVREMESYFGLAGEWVVHGVYEVYGLKASIFESSAGELTGGSNIWLFYNPIHTGLFAELTPQTTFKRDDGRTEIHELTHASLARKYGNDYVPLWLNEVLAYGISGGDYNRNIPREFYEVLSTLPLEHIIGVTLWPSGQNLPPQYRNTHFTYNLTQTIGVILLELDSDAIKKIGHRILGTDFLKDIPDEPEGGRNAFWLRVLNEELGIDGSRLVELVRQRIQERLAGPEGD